MLDIKLFREQADKIMDSEKKRFRETSNVEKVIEYDTLWREGERKLNSLRSEKNKLSIESSYNIVEKVKSMLKGEENSFQGQENTVVLNMPKNNEIIDRFLNRLNQ